MEEVSRTKFFNGVFVESIDAEQGTDAKRFNDGKVPMHLLPLWLLEDLAIHYGKGAEKYDPWNWLQGGSTDTCFGALMRHLTEWQAGQDLDEETQTHHMCAVAWNALALLHGYKMGVDRDDRPKLPLVTTDVSPDVSPEIRTAEVTLSPHDTATSRAGHKYVA